VVEQKVWPKSLQMPEPELARPKSAAGGVVHRVDRHPDGAYVSLSQRFL
jgi:hypothetical protein